MVDENYQTDSSNDENKVIIVSNALNIIDDNIPSSKDSPHKHHDSQVFPNQSDLKITTKRYQSGHQPKSPSTPSPSKAQNAKTVSLHLNSAYKKSESRQSANLEAKRKFTNLKTCFQRNRPSIANRKQHSRLSIP